MPRLELGNIDVNHGLTKLDGRLFRLIQAPERLKISGDIQAGPPVIIMCSGLKPQVKISGHVELRRGELAVMGRDPNHQNITVIFKKRPIDAVIMALAGQKLSLPRTRREAIELIVPGGFYLYYSTWTHYAVPYIIMDFNNTLVRKEYTENRKIKVNNGELRINDQLIISPLSWSPPFRKPILHPNILDRDDLNIFYGQLGTNCLSVNCVGPITAIPDGLAPSFVLPSEIPVPTILPNLFVDNLGSYCFMVITALLDYLGVAPAPAPASIPVLNQYSEQMSAYIRGRENTELKVEEIIASLELSEAEKTSFESFEDPITAAYMHTPVILNGRYYDISTISEFNFKDPLSRSEFSLKDLQPAYVLIEQFESLVEEVLKKRKQIVSETLGQSLFSGNPPVRHSESHNALVRHPESHGDEGSPEDSAVLNRGDPSSSFAAFRMTHESESKAPKVSAGITVLLTILSFAIIAATWSLLFASIIGAAILLVGLVVTGGIFFYQAPKELPCKEKLTDQCTLPNNLEEVKPYPSPLASQSNSQKTFAPVWEID